MGKEQKITPYGPPGQRDRTYRRRDYLAKIYEKEIPKMRDLKAPRR